MRRFISLVFLVLWMPTVAVAGYSVSVNVVPDFATSYKRLGILPATVPAGFDAVWTEEVLMQKIASRGLKAVPAQFVKQALFEMGATTPDPASIKAVSEKLGIDAFIVPTVGATAIRSSGSFSFGSGSATGTTQGNIWSAIGNAFGATVPDEISSGTVELLIVTADGRMLMRGQAFGESELRSLKGVLGRAFDQILDRTFTKSFFEKRKLAPQ